jgi:hypothetical protein
MRISPSPDVDEGVDRSRHSMATGAQRSDRIAGFVVSGGIAGAASTLVFTVIHQFLISPIWFAFPAMLVAGALCGISLAWSYAQVVRTPTIGSWVNYNGLYLAVLVALGLTSLAMFDPVTTIASLLAAKEPPRQLIGRALPMTVVFTVATAALISSIYRPGWRGAGGILVTAVVLILFLGLNISTLGLVAIPRSALGVIAEVLTLLIALSAVYVALVVALGWSRFGDRMKGQRDG